MPTFTLPRRLAGACALALCVILTSNLAAAQTSGLPADDAYPNRNYNSNDELKVTGQVEFIDKRATETIVWVRAKKVVKQGFGSRPGTEADGVGMLWRIEGPAIARLSEKDKPKLVVGAPVNVSGENSDDKTCKPTCRLNAARLSLK